MSVKKIPLPLKPIWMRQPEESEQHHAAFIGWAGQDGFTGASEWARKHGLSDWHVVRYRWQERGDAYWEDVSKRMQVGLATALERLHVRAIGAAHALMDMDRSEITKTTVEKKRDPRTGRSKTTHKSTRKVGPSERVVAQLLQKIYDGMQDEGGADYTEILRTMVQDTEYGGEPPTDSGVEGKPGAT